MSDLLLVNGVVLAPNGDRFFGATDVLMRDGVIAAIGQGLRDQHATGSEVIDLDGRFLTPGLIDSHYHLVSRSDVTMNTRAIAVSMIEGVANAEDCIASGVTTVRDCGCRHEGIFDLRDAVSNNIVTGPDSYIAGRNPTGKRAPDHWRNIVVEGPEQIRRAVRDQFQAGADWIKLILAHANDPYDWSHVIEFLDDEEIAAAVDEAHSLGLSIGGHCEGWDVAARAVKLGLDSLDHAPLVSEEVAAEMSRNGTFYVPTVWAFSDDAGVDSNALSTRQRESLAGWQEEHKRSVRRARAAGVRIAAGSDSADVLTGRGVLARELLALASCGLRSSEVLASATSTAADLMRRSHDLGRVDVGYAADLVVFDRDPLDDVSELGHPKLVFKNGRLAYDSERGIVPATDRRVSVPATTARWN
ncbi:MAG: amidohydrolase family protein [Lacisediminihabitans sp.]